MKFLIQKINNEIRHDFSFTLLESIRYHNWLTNSVEIKSKFIDYIDRYDNKIWKFKDYHRNYVPVGSVEFVIAYMEYFNIQPPLPMNVPDELIPYAGRNIINGTEKILSFGIHKFDEYFVKSNDKIKGFSSIVNCRLPASVPKGNYQVSNVIDIESEWRAFVYKGELVGMQNYSGDFTHFPNVWRIKEMIEKFESAPITYTLDVGITNGCDTVVIECHDFFSCGLYGFSDHRIYPHMLQRWFNQYEAKTILNLK